MSATSVEAEVRQKRPKLGKAADYGNSRRAAIHLFCLACIGGRRKDAVECESHTCPLWLYRPGATGERPAGAVPGLAEYDAAIEASVSEALREQGRRLGRMRAEERGGAV